MAKFLAFSGSTRKDSVNQKTAATLAAFVSAAGEEVEIINLGDFDMPIYQGDLEAESGLPEATFRLKEKLDGADALIIACPEYNGYMPPVLVNAIDWCTRSSEASVDLGCFMGKPVFIAAASPGPGGGGRVAVHLKTMLSGVGAYVSPLPLTVPAAFGAFTESGEFVDEGMAKRAQRMIGAYIEFAKKLA
jgi:NAD(P)H-dependent FMN reductase